MNESEQRPLSPVQAGLLSSIEKAFNQALSQAPQAQDFLGKHTGRLLSLQLERPAISAYLLFVEEGIEVYNASDATPDTTVQVSATELMTFLLAARRSPVSAVERLSIEGNRELLADFLSLGRELAIDWQRLLAPWLDTALLSQWETGRQMFSSWINDFGQQLQQTLKTRLRNTSPLMELRRDVYEFGQDLDSFEHDLTRLEGRIKPLA